MTFVPIQTSPSPWIFTINYGTPPQPPTPPSPAGQLADEARELARQGRDLGSVTYAIESTERARRRSIEESLEATLELEKLSSSGKTRITKEFILAYQSKDGTTGTVRGVEFPDHREDKTKDDCETRVVLDVVNGGAPVGKFHASITKLKETLTDKGFMRRIAYIDS